MNVVTKETREVGAGKHFFKYLNIGKPEVLAHRMRRKQLKGRRPKLSCSKRQKTLLKIWHFQNVNFQKVAKTKDAWLYVKIRCDRQFVYLKKINSPS